MSDAVEQIPVSRELQTLMRHAALAATELRDPFITMRALLLALLDEPSIGPALSDVIERDLLLEYEADAAAAARMTASRVADTGLDPGERPAILRFSTLAFKIPDGSRSVWLSREAFAAFCSGARRVSDDEAYVPAHLAQAIAADAVRATGLLSELGIEPGAVSDAVMKN